MATNPLDPLGWFVPKPAPAPAAPAPAPSLASLDFLGKLDSLLQEQQNTNALLNALLDQQASQQQVQRAQPAPTGQGLGGGKVWRTPHVYQNMETGNWYKVVGLFAPQTGANTVAAGTTVTSTSPTFMLSAPILIIGLYLVPYDDCGGLVTEYVAFNSVPLAMMANPIPLFIFLGIPSTTIASIVFGNYPQYIDFITLKCEQFYDAQFQVTNIFTNTDIADHIVGIQLQYAVLQSITDMEATRLRGE